MASLIVSCIMLAPLLGSLICVMCLLNDPPEAPPEDYYGPIDHGLQRFKRFYGRHIVWYRVSWLLIFILGVWAFRKRLETRGPQDGTSRDRTVLVPAVRKGLRSSSRERPRTANFKFLWDAGGRPERSPEQRLGRRRPADAWLGYDPV